MKNSYKFQPTAIMNRRAKIANCSLIRKQQILQLEVGHRNQIFQNKVGIFFIRMNWAKFLKRFENWIEANVPKPLRGPKIHLK